MNTKPTETATNFPANRFESVNAYKPGSQNYHILDHLIQKGRITALEALSLYRVFRLAARICDIRDDGYTIHTRMKTDITGKRYAEYRKR